MKTLLAVILMLMSEVAIADTVTSGSVDWEATGNPGFVKIDGEGGKPTGTVTIANGKASGTFDCALSDFTTGIELRDEHMRNKFLEVGKFPKATLVLSPTPTTGDVDWTGQLTIKGVTKPVKGKAHVTATDVDATFVVSLTDYPIGVPSFLGVTVAKEVTVHVKAKVGK